MKDSDIIIGWMDPDDNPHLLDTYGTGNQRPSLDAKQDLHMEAADEQGGLLRMNFWRWMDTCDGDNDIKITVFKTIYPSLSHELTNKLTFRTTP